MGRCAVVTFGAWEETKKTKAFGNDGVCIGNFRGFLRGRRIISVGRDPTPTRVGKRGPDVPRKENSLGVQDKNPSGTDSL